MCILLYRFATATGQRYSYDSILESACFSPFCREKKKQKKRIRTYFAMNGLALFIYFFLLLSDHIVKRSRNSVRKRIMFLSLDQKGRFSFTWSSSLEFIVFQHTDALPSPFSVFSSSLTHSPFHYFLLSLCYFLFSLLSFYSNLHRSKLEFVYESRNVIVTAIEFLSFFASDVL